MTPKKLSWLPDVLAGLLFGGKSDQRPPQATVGSEKHVRLPSLGVFIDFDNINGAAIPLVFQYLAPHWDSTWRRAYGTNLAKHRGLFHASGILPIEVIPNSPRKNSTDIALVIDVVLAACSDSVDAFCIVSSDADYTRLALALREKGKRLLIMGRATTPPSLRSACAEFIDLDELASSSPQAAVRNGRLAAAAASGAGDSLSSGNRSQPQAPVAPQIIGGEQPSGGVRPAAQVDAAELIPLIRELTGDHGTTTLQAIQLRCSRRYTDFSPRMCGVTKWRTLLQRMAVFTVEPIKDKNGNIQDYAVAFRPAALAPEVLIDPGSEGSPG